jgi:hypothetical protein
MTRALVVRVLLYARTKMRAFNIVLGVAVIGGLGFALITRDPIKAEAEGSASAHPAAMPAAAAQAEQGAALEGEVLEVIDVPGYTYLRVGPKGGPGEWAAVATVKLAVGDRARITSATRMVDFRSETLDRKFDVIYFGSLNGDPGAGAANPHAAMPGADPHAGMPGANPHAAGTDPLDPQAKPRAEVKVGKVDKATGEGAFRIAEIYAKKNELSGKTVRVRGVVVKATPGILGKTFMHVRDGSGDEASANHDLTITTEATVKVGDTVTAEGVVALAKDIGAGYRYDVLIEQATLHAK